jgi:hypothetical protein
MVEDSDCSAGRLAAAGPFDVAMYISDLAGQMEAMAAESGLGDLAALLRASARQARADAVRVAGRDQGAADVA